MKRSSTVAALVLLSTLAVASAQEEVVESARLVKLVAQAPSPLAPLIDRYATDRRSLFRYYGALQSSEFEAIGSFYSGWKKTLDQVDFDSLNAAGRVDFILFQKHFDYQLRRLSLEKKRKEKTARFLPFRESILALERHRLRMEPVQSRQTADHLDQLTRQVREVRHKVEQEWEASRKKGEPFAPQALVNRAWRINLHLRKILKRWFQYYDGYDPLFTWWVDRPYQDLDHSLQQYGKLLREKIVGVKEGDKEAIIGDPIGREALLVELDHEMIPYTPEELITIAHKEYDWCLGEMLKASAQLGYGRDWKAALEHVKEQFVEPGEQPTLIRDLAREAIRFVKDHDLVTVPPLAEKTIRMTMMSPERQLVNPFFLGGEVIQVSYPTNTMTHEQKLMSLRGNNRYFSRAVVHHELIPGHHLQGFMTARYNTQRRIFSTPFWGEGWALYWELRLWDLGFARTPEEKIGMLFWRMHRAARIIFSLSFHLGKMTPRQCVDFLVEKVGHERANAAGEVRRSFSGGYSPLYQCAYMLGGLQFRALERELVGGGRMSEREFHDAILRENSIPVEMVRVLLTGRRLERDFHSSWRFY